eukprot:jgi/Chlat1/4152/Chrsp27S04229
MAAMAPRGGCSMLLIVGAVLVVGLAARGALGANPTASSYWMPSDVANGLEFHWTQNGGYNTFICRHHIKAHVQEDLDQNNHFAADQLVQTDPASIADTQLDAWGYDWRPCGMHVGGGVWSETIPASEMIDGYHTFTVKGSNDGGVTYPYWYTVFEQLSGSQNPYSHFKIDSKYPTLALDTTNADDIWYTDTNTGVQQLQMVYYDVHGTTTKVDGTTAHPNPPYSSTVKVENKLNCQANDVCELDFCQWWWSWDQDVGWSSGGFIGDGGSVFIDIANTFRLTDNVHPQNFETGSHTLQVSMSDLAGNRNPNFVTWTFYKSHTSSTDGCTYNIAFNGRQVTCMPDFVRLAGGVSEVDFSDMTSDEYELVVRAEDSFGNTGYNNTFGWIVDNEYTGAQFLATERPGAAATSLRIQFKSDNSARAFKVEHSWVAGSLYIACNVNDATCTEEETFAAGTFPTGSYWYSVAAVDAVGNINPDPIVYKWTVDPIDTDVTSVLTADGVIITPFATRDSAVTEFVYEWKLDNTKWKKGKGPSFTVKGVKDGLHTVMVRAAGLDNMLWDPTPKNWTWSVDTVAPEVTITNSPGSVTGSTNAFFEITATESGLQEYRLDNGPYVPFSFLNEVSLQDLTEGPHTFTVRVTDANGNIGKPEEYSWIIDNGDPDTFVLSGPSTPTFDTQSMFSFGSTESGVSYQYKVDQDAEWTDIDGSTLTTRQVGQGLHMLQVRAMDAAENLDPTPAVYSWTVYSTAVWEDCKGCHAEAEAETFVFPAVSFAQL